MATLAEQATARGVHNLAELLRPRHTISEAHHSVDELNSSPDILREVESQLRESRWLQVAIAGTTGSTPSFPLTEEFVKRVKLFNDTPSQQSSWQNLIVRQHNKTGPVTLAHHPAFAADKSAGESIDDQVVDVGKIAFAVSSLLEMGTEDGVLAFTEATVRAARSFAAGGASASEEVVRGIHSCPVFALMCRSTYEADMTGALGLADRATRVVDHWKERMVAAGVLTVDEAAALHADLEAQLRCTAQEAAFLAAWCEVANSKFMTCVPSPDRATDAVAAAAPATAAAAAASAGAAVSAARAATAAMSVSSSTPTPAAPLAVKYDKSRHCELEYDLPSSRQMKQGKVGALAMGLLLRPRPAAAGGDAAGSAGAAAAAAGAAVGGAGTSSDDASGRKPLLPFGAAEALAIRPVRITAAEDCAHCYPPDTKVWMVPSTAPLTA